MEKVKNKDQEILGYCGLCGKAIRKASSFDLVNVGGKTKACCKGGCEE